MQTLRGLGPSRLAAVGGVGIGILAFFIYLMARMATPQMELLYGDLQLSDANQIVTKLTAEKIPYELRKEGTEVWVPKEKKLDLRVKMAEQSLPSGGSVSTGYEVFDKTEALGSTSFMQNINLVRAMEGELARTIRSIDKVKSARVHLVLARREVFSRETQEPSASVVLSMQGNARLNHQQVQAIQHLIAAAVPQLKPSRISIVDDHGTLLARGFDNDQQAMAEDADERRLQYEQRIGRHIEELIEHSVGPGKVRAEVTAELDLDRVATTQEIFDPESKVERSHVTVDDNQKSQENENASVSVAQNLPDVAQNASTGRTNSSQVRTQETVNYEISKTTRNQVKEMGTIKRLSVAVLVDGKYVAGENGQRTYQKLSDGDLESISSLVRSAIGYDSKRGDTVEVVNLPFFGAEEAEVAPKDDRILGFEREFVEKIASQLGLAVVAILFLLLVLRPLVGRAVESMAAGGVADSRRLLADQSMAQAALAAPAPPPPPGLVLTEETVEELIDIDKVEGRVKASSIRKIGEIVEKHPDEALSIIRNWMYQET